MFTQLAASWNGNSASFKKMVKIAGGVGVIAGAVTASAAAWVIVEPWWYAHRAYVREQRAEVEDKVTKALNPALATIGDIQIDASWTRQLQIDDAIARWELQLEKAPSDDEKLRIRSQVNALKREHKLLDEKMATIKARGR